MKRRVSRQDKIDFILTAMSVDAIKIWDIHEPSVIKFMQYATYLLQTSQGSKWESERRGLIQKAKLAHQRLYNFAQKICGQDKVKRQVFVTELETLWAESPDRISVGSDEFVSGFKAGVILDEVGEFALSDFGFSTNRGLRKFSVNVDRFIKRYKNRSGA